MARNFAQIVFLIYALGILLVTRKHIESILIRKMGEGALRRRVRGGANRFLFLTVREKMPPALYWLNLINYAAIALFAVIHLVLGWFSFMDLFLKITNSLILLSCGIEAYFLALAGNLMQFGELFFLYRVDSDDSHDRAFASSVIDALVYAVIPVLLVICNFIAL